MRRVAKGAVALSLSVLLTFYGMGAIAFAQPGMLTAGDDDLTGQSDDVPASFDLRDVDGTTRTPWLAPRRPRRTPSSTWTPKLRLYGS